MGSTGRRLAATLGMTLAVSALPAAAQADGWHHQRGNGRLTPGNIVISRSVYQQADIQPGVTQLPPGCTAGNCATAVADGAYPYVFNNDSVDGSFGITSPLFLDELTPWGQLIKTIPVPTDQLVTSFSSKSEGALNVSTNGREVSFIDYVAPVDTIDASNANTPGEVDPTNPVPGAYYRAAAVLGPDGRFQFTKTNAYSGNNGRAAILNNAGNVFYTAGNAGNGSNPQPTGVVLGAGTQIFSRSFEPEAAQSPGTPTPVGSFDVTQLGDPQDKIGKDDNFRGLTVYNNVVYLTKGSGSNGVNTVYFIDTTGKACPSGGTGLPVPGAKLPTTALDPAPAQTTPPGPLASNMCVLQGFNTGVAKTDTSHFPFGLWFANSKTLYVADEGDGTTTYDATTNTYTDAAGQTTAGLQKWVFNSQTQSWQLAYVLQNGLELGQPYTVPGYPTGDNTVGTGKSAVTLPWAPATDGLRNITGRVNRDGTVTIWAVTSTVSGSGDQGADPNEVVKITDRLGATTLPGSESFQVFAPPTYDQVYRGVSVTPWAGGGHGFGRGRGFGGDHRSHRSR
jgi:hypothetical protein